MPAQPIPLAAHLSASLLLAFFAALLLRHDPRPYLRLWSAAWVAQALAVAVTAAPAGTFASGAHALFAASYAALVIGAARSDARGSSGFRPALAVAAVAAWALLAPRLLPDQQLLAGERALLALAHGAAALVLWPLRETQAMGLRLTTTALALRALVDLGAAAASLGAAGIGLLAFVPGAELLLSLAIALGLGLTVSDAAQFALATTHQQLKEAEHRLKVLGETDALTGCFNRRVFRELVDDLRSSGQAQHGVVLLVDVEGLRAVNERDGQAAGDDLLRHTAEAIRGRTRATDIVVRWGGGTFIVVIPGAGRSEGDARREQLADAIGEQRLPAALSASVYGPGVDILLAVEDAERGLVGAVRPDDGRALG
jgi:diguanylate cyclase (GGDEF)-like protein